VNSRGQVPLPEQLGVLGDVVTDARRGSPYDRVNVVLEAIVTVDGVELCHGQQVFGTAVHRHPRTKGENITILRDSILTHSTMAKGLIVLFSAVPAKA